MSQYEPHDNRPIFGKVFIEHWCSTKMQQLTSYNFKKSQVSLGYEAKYKDNHLLCMCMSI
jgi:hypothetical protein